MSLDRRDNHFTFSSQVEVGADGSDVARDLRRFTVIAPRREPGGLSGGIDTPHLHRHGGEPGHAQHQDRHQRGDCQRRLDGGGPGLAGQTLVFNARLMMFVSAVTTESPVTTV